MNKQKSNLTIFLKNSNSKKSLKVLLGKCENIHKMIISLKSRLTSERNNRDDKNKRNNDNVDDIISIKFNVTRMNVLKREHKSQNQFLILIHR